MTEDLKEIYDDLIALGDVVDEPGMAKGSIERQWYTCDYVQFKEYWKKKLKHYAVDDFNDMLMEVDE